MKVRSDLCIFKLTDEQTQKLRRILDIPVIEIDRLDQMPSPIIESDSGNLPQITTAEAVPFTADAIPIFWKLVRGKLEKHDGIRLKKKERQYLEAILRRIMECSGTEAALLQLKAVTRGLKRRRIRSKAGRWFAYHVVDGVIADWETFNRIFEGKKLHGWVSELRPQAHQKTDDEKGADQEDEPSDEALAEIDTEVDEILAEGEQIIKDTSSD